MAELFEIPLNGNNNQYEKTIENALKHRILIFNQDVDDSLVEDIAMHIINWNIEDYGKPKNKRKPITILLNSCGGDAYTGFNIVDVIEQSTTPIIGVALGLTASAAYYIYLACHERVAFKNSIFLQHDGSVSVTNSNRKAQDTMKFFDYMEQRTKDYVLSHTSMTEEYYDDHYDQELYFYPDKGKELGVVHKVIGEDVSLDKVFCGE